MITTVEVAEAIQALGNVRRHLESQIGRQPTGHARNELSEANIHVMLAESRLAKVVDLLEKAK